MQLNYATLNRKSTDKTWKNPERGDKICDSVRLWIRAGLKLKIVPGQLQFWGVGDSEGPEGFQTDSKLV